MLEFVKYNQDEILEINKYDLEDIVERVYPEDIASLLLEFISVRKQENLDIVYSYNVNHNSHVEFDNDNVWTLQRFNNLKKNYE